MNNYPYIFLCSTYPEEYDRFFSKLSGKDSTTSGNIHSLSIINAFMEKEREIFVISGVGIGHYPLNSSVKKVPDVKISNSFYCVGYNNHFLVSQHSKAKAMYHCFKNNYPDKTRPINILLADIHEPFAKAALKIRRHNKNVKIVNICLDVPDTIKSSNETFLRRLLKKISIRRNLRLLKKMDGFVLLSKEMEKRLPINNKPVLISPCLSKIDLYDKFVKASHKTTKVVYCGVISKQYNIDFLLDAFSLIKEDNFELEIAGKGDGVELIKQRAKIDRRIKFLGELPRREALQLQLNANVLVNPRLPEKTYTSYSFPSKTISYLLSGNPLVCYTFDSFPETIRKMVFEPKEITPESFAKTILDASKHKSKVNFSNLNKYSSEEFINYIDKLFAIIRSNEDEERVLSIN